MTIQAPTSPANSSHVGGTSAGASSPAAACRNHHAGRNASCATASRAISTQTMGSSPKRLASENAACGSALRAPAAMRRSRSIAATLKPISGRHAAHTAPPASNAFVHHSRENRRPDSIAHMHSPTATAA